VRTSSINREGAGAAAATERGAAGARRFRILVIDDDEIVRATLDQVLRRAGYVVDFATDGKEGVERCRATSPDLVITDMIMPEKEGIETIADLRVSPATIPIIAMSGGGRIDNVDVLERARQVGADATIGKPFEAQGLLRLVAQCLFRPPHGGVAA
jgi:CheY-like chemotaxis protein